MLRDELEIALGETGKFKVVTRDRLADLQMEGKFQGKGVLEPGTGVEKVSIEGVKGIVRGRFYATGDGVTVFAELAWQPDPMRGPHAGVELLHTGSIAVDDRNTDAAPASTVASLRAGWRHELDGWRLAGAVRVDNVADARIVGAVIVNEGQRRFFEPAPGRAWFAGVSVSRSL
jgi:hypothetical protein